MTLVWRPALLGAAARRRTAVPAAEVALWAVATVVVGAYLAQGTPQTGHRLLVGNLALAAALVYGTVRCTIAARRRTGSRRAWGLMAIALALGTLAQLLFTSSLLQGAAPAPSPVTDLFGYLGYSLPLLVALFLFPRPPERLLSRFRGVLDALVITVGVVLVSEGTVLGVLRRSLDTTTFAGLAPLAYPVADVALCAVVLTLGMRQAPRARLTWLCLGSGMVSLAVTDSIYVRLLADGARDLTGTPLLVGWMAAPVLIGLATRVRSDVRRDHGRNLDLLVQLVPYVPVLAAAVVLALRPVRSDAFLLVGGLVLFAAVSVRQVMIVWENLSLTRGLEHKVAERTAQLATLGSIVTSSRDAIVGIGLSGSITAWNPAAEALFGHRAVDVLGQDPGFLARASREDADALLLAATRGETLGTHEIDWNRPDGSSVPVALTVSPILDDGVVSGISFSGQDITERRRAAETLERAREDALQSARAKSDFLATMSHEIRTPMNGVIGLVSLLMDTELDPRQRDYVDGVHQAGQALLDVINDILDFSKLEAGKLELDAGAVDLRRLAEEVGDLLAPAAFAKGLELLVDVDPATVAVVTGDRVRLRQVLLNLASNAVKFTATGQVQIRVFAAPVVPPVDAAGDATAALGDARVQVEVVDTGIGIAGEDRERLFESFSQADASTTRRYGGTGLGLAICRRLIEAMGGEIGVRSTLGHGSTFWFEVTLPLGESSTLPVVGPGALALPPRLRALVVDDNATNRAILVAQLEAWGVRTDVADGAGTALEALRAARTALRAYDVAILDMMMPDVDGLELARRISADPELAGLPMIMFSSAPRPSQDALRDVGVGAWLSKPIRTAALRDGVARLVADAALPSTPPARDASVPASSDAGRSDTVLSDAALSDAAPSDTALSDTGAPSRGRVLVVEDNELNQLVARGLVERLGFEADVARNGVEALDALGCQTYDVVLMDCHMPVLDGFAATERIREVESGRTRTPVVALTASALVSDRERCLAAGMDDYLSKPIVPDVLAEVLERWVPARHDGGGTGAEPAAPPDGQGETQDGARIDTEQIQSLAELRTPDGVSLLSRFVSSFASRADDRLDTIRACLRRADDEALAQAAHELRGSAATIGASRVASLCAELEHGGSQVLSVRPRVVDDLASELALAVHELDAIAGRAA